MKSSRAFNLASFTTALLIVTSSAQAGGGYFALGYGPIARQMAGATTAYGNDAFAGASNPAKWLAAGNRLDFGTEFFMPYRKSRSHRLRHGVRLFKHQRKRHFSIARRRL